MVPMDYLDYFVDGLFGKHDPRQMPEHFFWRHKGLDYDSAIQADVSKQNYSVCPRHWYVDAAMRCEDCHEMFCWTAQEQHQWFEEFGFYVDSFAKRCLTCRQH